MSDKPVRLLESGPNADVIKVLETMLRRAREENGVGVVVFLDLGSNHYSSNWVTASGRVGQKFTLMGGCDYVKSTILRSLEPDESDAEESD